MPSPALDEHLRRGNLSGAGGFLPCRRCCLRPTEDDPPRCEHYDPKGECPLEAAYAQERMAELMALPHVEAVDRFLDISHFEPNELPGLAPRLYLVSSLSARSMARPSVSARAL